MHHSKSWLHASILPALRMRQNDSLPYPLVRTVAQAFVRDATLPLRVMRLARMDLTLVPTDRLHGPLKRDDLTGRHVGVERHRLISR